MEYSLLLVSWGLGQHIILHTSNKNFFLDVGMEKEQKQELDGGYLYYPFLHSTVYCVLATQL